MAYITFSFFSHILLVYQGKAGWNRVSEHHLPSVSFPCLFIRVSKKNEKARSAIGSSWISKGNSSENFRMKTWTKLGKYIERLLKKIQQYFLKGSSGGFFFISWKILWEFLKKFKNRFWISLNNWLFFSELPGKLPEYHSCVFFLNNPWIF